MRTFLLIYYLNAWPNATYTEIDGFETRAACLRKLERELIENVKQTFRVARMKPRGAYLTWGCFPQWEWESE